jgi:hypothetical protein
LQKELVKAWRGKELAKHAKAMTLNVCRDENLEGQQKTFSSFFFWNCVVA